MSIAENKLVGVLVEWLKNHELNIGDRLPSERQLSTKLKTSRTSLRNALKMLQAKGVLEAKPGSGYYLNQWNYLESFDKLSTEKCKKQQISNQLEAFFYFEPLVASIAASRISEKQLKKFENIVVLLSKAVLNKDMDKIKVYHVEFHSVMINSVDNSYIVRMLEGSNKNHDIISDIITELTFDELNDFFASHVNLLQAIKLKDSDKSKELCSEMLCQNAGFLNKYKQIPVPEVIRLFKSGINYEM